jgi:hypothetical protein
MNPPFIPNQAILIRKLEWGTRRERVSYPATVVEVTDRTVVVAAQSTLDHVALDGVVIIRQDQYTEYYYQDRWYNVCHIATPTGETKGWYCNVAMPCEADTDGIRFVDLYLDLFVHPDGHCIVLDEDEFQAISHALGGRLVQEARAALHELMRLSRAGSLPRPPGTDPRVTP